MKRGPLPLSLRRCCFPFAFECHKSRKGNALDGTINSLGGALLKRGALSLPPLIIVLTGMDGGSCVTDA